jgi:hypothetical protein
MRQGSSPDPSRSATNVSLGLAFLDVRVSAKTEEPENEEHDNHGADDVDNSIHDPFSLTCMEHSSYQNRFCSRSRKLARLLPAAPNISMRHAISRTPHQFLMPLDHINGCVVDLTQPNEALSRLVTCASRNSQGKDSMTIGTILIIVLIVALLGGFTGVVGGYGYGFGHGGVGVLGTVLIIVVILVLLGRL